jgi:hypothetical protein
MSSTSVSIAHFFSPSDDSFVDCNKTEVWWCDSTTCFAAFAVDD